MVFEQIRDIVCEQFDVDRENVTEDTDFLSDLDADSLDVVELAMSIEEAFHLPEIGEDDIRSIATVGDLVAYVNRALG
ncbi:MAG: acyl carrier protein [Oscillospiraceae bacterium]|nr:acyl carrier protein [Oscillospiraceae bacterium]